MRREAAGGSGRRKRSGTFAPLKSPAGGVKMSMENAFLPDAFFPLQLFTRSIVMKQTNSRSGTWMMLAASLLFSAGGLLCKVIPWGAFALNGVRNLLAGVVIALYLIIRRHKPVFNRYTFFGAIAYMGTTTLFVAANKLTTAANTIVLQYTAPIWIIVMMAVFFRETPTKLQIITFVVVFGGILCFFLDSLGGGSTLGNGIALASGVCYAGLFVLNSFPEGDTLSALLLGQAVSAVVMGPAVLRETDFSAAALIGVAVLGLIQVGVAYIFFSEATARISPVTASLIGAIEPILNPLLVAAVLRESMSVMAGAGAVIVVAAVAAYNVLKAREKHGSA